MLAGLFRLGESRVSAFYASIVRLRLPGTGNTYIVDKAGQIIYDSGYQRTGQTIDLSAVNARGICGGPPGAEASMQTGTRWCVSYCTRARHRLVTGHRDRLGRSDGARSSGSARASSSCWRSAWLFPPWAWRLLARGQRSAVGDADQAAVEARVGKAMRDRLLPQFHADGGRMGSGGAPPARSKWRQRPTTCTTSCCCPTAA